MTATIKVGEEGLILLPEEMRHALHLVPGSVVEVEQTGNVITLQTMPAARGLYMERGLLVYDNGRQLPPEHVEWINNNREERAGDIPEL